MKRLTIGGDPEFRYQNEDASFFQARGGAWGCDGYESTAELRIGYSNNVIVMVSKIHHLMRLVARNPSIGKLKWIAGSYVDNAPIGGHIHIRHPEWPGIKTKTTRGYSSFEYYLVWLLDSLLFDGVGSIIQDPRQRAKRAEVWSGFGKKGNFCKSERRRLQETNGIEYRSCGSWIVSPEISLIYLGIAKICAGFMLGCYKGEVTLNGRERLDKVLSMIVKTTFSEYRRKELIKLVRDALTIINKTIYLPEDCIAAIDAFNIVADAGKVDWTVDLKDTWEVFI